MMKQIPRIVSGGQSGADRAASDWALSHNLPCGGGCPKGRKVEDGPINTKYPLKESSSASYLQRTKWNVRDSDATINHADAIETRCFIGGGQPPDQAKHCSTVAGHGSLSELSGDQTNRTDPAGVVRRLLRALN